jgi:DNA-binding NtrC family response regulator
MANRILIVEDERSLLLTLAANLELEGFEVEEAPSAERALELMAARRFDLILSDIRMPGMSGVELYHRIRAEGNDVPVVLMTAFAAEGLVDDAIANGAFTVIPKPFDVDRLIETLAIAARRPLVLVVDDEIPVAESTAAALCAAGVRARAVYDGDGALRTIHDAAVDVCVVDMVMPGLAGPELIESIAGVDGTIICIAVSGHDVPQLFERAAAHAYACLRKPVAPLDLVHFIAGARARACAR